MLNGKSILVVDQDPLMREILEDSLHLFDCEVHCASTIKDALEVLANESIDAVICEDQLERGTGLELLMRMKNCDLDIPFALMTGSEWNLCREAVFEAGVRVVFEKPFGLDDFLEGMRVILSNCPTTERFLEPLEILKHR
jgi:two-component system C4-dicarboxylate transport response regulator DctD